MTRHRRAFTLVELLVVASILIVLFGFVAANARPVPVAARAAQDFASILLATQGKALGRTEGAAVIIEALTGDPRIGGTVGEGTMLPPVVADVEGGELVDSPELAGGYKVQFRDKAGGDGGIAVSPWLGLEDGEPVRRASAGQTESNTILLPPGDNLDALVVRYPVSGPKPVRLSEQLAVDLRHSGVGNDSGAAHGHGRFEGQGPVAVVFDQTGRVAEVIMRVGAGGGPAPITPNEIIYFYFVNREAIDASRSLLSAAGTWVAIDPQTGRISVSSNVPSAEDQLTEARAKARLGTALGK